MYNAYLIFEDSDSGFTRTLKKHWRHVSVIVPCNETQYIHIDPRLRGINYRLIEQDEVDNMYDKVLYQDIAIVRTVVNKGINKVHMPMVITCVEVVKRVLGVHAWWILTPRQLYNYVRCRECKRVCQAIQLGGYNEH